MRVPLLSFVLCASIAAHAADNFRTPASQDDLRFWLENMVAYHRFTVEEVQAATGLKAESVREKLAEFKISPGQWPPGQAGPQVLPYPGGRHPRIGFLDGAVDPQRETKISVFCPWDNASYVVVDVPEAIWCQKGLLYLAHTHVPTIWSKQNIELPKLEWSRKPAGVLESERTLPNKVAFGARVEPRNDGVRMELWLRNDSSETYSDLRVQNCVMLKGATGFTTQTNANKVFAAPFVACRSTEGDKWIITAWVPGHRTWANAPVPCLHSDPKFPDCPPGKTERLRGWLSFYEGRDMEAEFARLRTMEWLRP